MANSDTAIEEIGSDAEWETIVEESGEKIVFSKPGDSFTGVYAGTVTISPKGEDKDGKQREAFDQQLFRDKAGKLYATNGGYKIREGLADVPEGSIVRITFVGTVPIVGQPSPMNDFRIEVARKK